MNKLFTKIAALSVGLAMAIGVGVAVGGREARRADAAESVVATFNCGADGAASHSDGSGTSTDSITDGSYTLSITNGTNFYKNARDATGNGCYKLGTSNNAGSFQFTAPSDITTVKIYFAGYKANDGYYVLNGAAQVQVTNHSADGSYATITVNTSTNKTVSFGTGSSGKRGMINTIEFWKDAGAPVKADVTLSLGSASGSMSIGTDQQLTPTATSGGNPVQGLTYSYATGDASIATVSNTGLIEAVAAGSTTITVTSAATDDYNAGSVVLNLTVSDPYIVANLDFPVPGQGNTNDYQSSFDATDNNYAFTITNANNSNSGWDHIRIGRKSAASTATIVSNSALTERITSVVIDFSAYTASGLDSATLYVGGDSSFTNAYSKEFKSDITTASLVSVEIPTAKSAANKFYKLEFVCNSSYSSGNGYIHVDQIVFRADPVSTTPSATLDEDEVTLYTNNSAGVTAHVTVENCDNATIDWSTSSNKITLENDDEETVTIKPTVNASETDVTVTLTVTGTGLSVEETLTVHLVEPGPGETPETAYTVAQAKAAIEAASEDVADIYIAGKISQVDSYNSTYHSITYWISDDGTTTDQFKIYSGKGLSGADFSSKDDLEVGDQVVLFGTISKQYTNLNANNYIVSRTPVPKVNSITLTPNIITVEPEATGNVAELFTDIAIDQDEGCGKTVNDIVWTSDNNSVFSISNGAYTVTGEHKDSTTINATIGGTVYGSATLNVVNPNQPYITYDIPVEWTKLTSLTVGDTIAFVHESSSAELTSVTTTGTTIGAVTTYETNPSGSYLLTVEAGNGGTGYSFKTKDDTYLSWTTGNSLTTSANKDDASSWTIHASHDGTEGDWKFVNVGDTSRVLQYNSGSPRFACYGNDGQTVFQIMKRTGGDTGTIDLNNTILTLVQSKMSTYQDEHGEDQYGISVCDYFRTTELSLTTWNNNVATGFTSEIISTFKLNYARSNRNGNDVEKFLSAYDYVVENYGADFDFLGRIASGKVVVGQGRIDTRLSVDGNNAVTAVIIISAVTLLGVGGYFFIRKKKEQ